MENTIVIILVILSLLLGGVVGAVITPNDAEVQIEYQDKIIEKIVNVSVDKVVEVEIPAPNQLEIAVAEFMKAVDDEEDEAGNDVDVVGSYDFDEIEISKVYDDYTVTYDGDETTVDFRIKLRFDEDGEASEKKTFLVKVIFEDGEDTEVEAVEED